MHEGVRRKQSKTLEHPSASSGILLPLGKSGPDHRRLLQGQGSQGLQGRSPVNWLTVKLRGVEHQVPEHCPASNGRQGVTLGRTLSSAHASIQCTASRSLRTANVTSALGS